MCMYVYIYKSTYIQVEICVVHAYICTYTYTCLRDPATQLAT